LYLVAWPGLRMRGMRKRPDLMGGPGQKEEDTDVMGGPQRPADVMQG